MSRAEELAEQFLQNAKRLHTNVEPIRVLRARAFLIGSHHVLIRAATEGKNRRYFFGLNYINAEEMANLENAYFAFVCGSIEQTVIIPSSVLIDQLPLVSHDRNGEYKLTFDSNLDLVLSGHGNRLDCSRFVNDWDSLRKPNAKGAEIISAEESIHSVIQGRLLEIGNIRGFKTFCPNKSRTFNGRKLQEIASLRTCPDLQFSEYDVLRQIDVLWFKEQGSHHIPECGFEVELSTGTWSGVGRLAVLLNYTNVRLFVISSETRKYQHVMSAFADYQERYKHVPTESIGDLYAAELNLRAVRHNIGI